MNKKGSRALIISIVVLLIFVVILFFFFALFRPSYSKGYNGVAIPNPTDGLTTEQAIASFNESFVSYILYSIKAYNLHNPPLSSNDPRIEFKIDSDLYWAVIQNGVIQVSKTEMNSPDVIITTTKEEGVKMVQNKEYIQQSFSSGKSGIELLASKATLFAKGYLSLYTSLTGKSVTGNVVRIYSS